MASPRSRWAANRATGSSRTRVHYLTPFTACALAGIATSRAKTSDTGCETWTLRSSRHSDVRFIKPGPYQTGWVWCPTTEMGTFVARRGGMIFITGNSFMEAFTRAFAPSIPVTIALKHPVSSEAATVIRAALLAPLTPRAPEPTPEPTATPTGRVYRGKRKHVVHDAHAGIEPVEWYDSLAAAQATGLRSCRVCRPT